LRPSGRPLQRRLAAGGRAGVQADGRRCGHIERFFAPGLRNPHRKRRSCRHVGTHALPFVSQNPCARIWRGALVQEFALVGTRHGQGHVEGIERPRIRPFDQVQAEMRRPCLPAAPWVTTALPSPSAPRPGETRRPRHCAGWSRHCRHPAPGPAPPWGHRAARCAPSGSSIRKPIGAGDSSPLTSANRRSGITMFLIATDDQSTLG
jgi:hypothetical protein